MKGDAVLPANPSKPEITAILRAWSAGDESAIQRLTPLVYGELRRLAHQHMRGEAPGHTLQTTALVNEAYVRLVDARVAWQGSSHFFAVSSSAMRRILVDFARARRYQKRGGDMQRVCLDEALTVSNPPVGDLVSLDRALTKLEAQDPRKAMVVELRYFGGRSNQEAARILDVSVETVIRDWRFAKSWLRRELGGESD